MQAEKTLNRCIISGFYPIVSQYTIDIKLLSLKLFPHEILIIGTRLSYFRSR